MALAVVESSYPDPHTMKHTVNGWSLFETSIPTVSDIPPPKPHLFPQTVPPAGEQVFKHRPVGVILSQTATVCLMKYYCAGGTVW